jgi:hypothetical protein
MPNVIQGRRRTVEFSFPIGMTIENNTRKRIIKRNRPINIL